MVVSASQRGTAGRGGVHLRGVRKKRRRMGLRRPDRVSSRPVPLHGARRPPASFCLFLFFAQSRGWRACGSPSCGGARWWEAQRPQEEPRAVCHGRASSPLRARRASGTCARLATARGGSLRASGGRDAHMWAPPARARVVRFCLQSSRSEVTAGTVSKHAAFVLLAGLSSHDLRSSSQGSVCQERQHWPPMPSLKSREQSPRYGPDSISLCMPCRPRFGFLTKHLPSRPFPQSSLTCPPRRRSCYLWLASSRRSRPVRCRCFPLLWDISAV